MSDFLVELGKNPRARSLVQSLGLPIPLPQALRRDKGAWKERPFADAKVAVGAAPGAELVAALAEILAAGGGDPYLSVPSDLVAAFKGPGETFGRPARALDALTERMKADVLVFDATGVTDVKGLRTVYDFFHPLVTRLARSARVVVLARGSEAVSPEGAPPEAAAAQAALEGFVRSAAKEIGKFGATANLVVVEKGAEARLGPVLRFVLSPRSAFVTGQPIVVGSRAKALQEPSLVRPLEKKIALVTGAARGIGEATARALAQEGAHVICLDRPADDGPTSQLARSIGGTALGADMADPEAPAKIADCVKGLGGIDVIVHNAGITRDRTLARMKPEVWDSVLDINLAAVVRTTAALEPHLRDYARIVCLSSIAGIAGNMGQTNYAASKGGIVGYVRTKALELAPRGITVNAVAPGFIETRMTAAIPVAIREVARRLSALGQGGQPEDVAQAITFLASPGAHGITGRTLRVCGGAFIGA
jgi:3-oxoacyl-[acyl-carrier protein] reductase